MKILKPRTSNWKLFLIISNYNLEKNQINKEKVRDTKENVLQKFRSLKQINKLNKLNLISLLENCNTIEDIIIYYLDYLKLTNDDDYKNELKSYYTIISPRECKKHGIMKVSERHKFHDLMNFIIKEKEIKNYVKKELTEVTKEINHLYEEEVKDLIDEKEKEKRKEDFIRWDNIYNTNIDFNDIYNEEYFYYKLSCYLSDGYEQQGLEVFLDGEPKQEASHEDHDEVAPCGVGEACVCKELVEVRYDEFCKTHKNTNKRPTPLPLP